MKKFLFTSLLIMCLSAVGFAQSVAQEIQANVKWIFETAGNAPPARLGVWAYDVPMGPDGTIRTKRGNLGALDCGSIGVLYALAGNRQAALEWLCAAQGHSPDVRSQFIANPDYTIDWAVNNYTSTALSHGGLGTTFSSVKQIGSLLGGVFNKSHDPGNPPAEPKIQRDPPEAGSRSGKW